MAKNEKTGITLHESLLRIRDSMKRPREEIETELTSSAKRKRVLSEVLPLVVLRPGRSVIRKSILNQTLEPSCGNEEDSSVTVHTQGKKGAETSGNLASSVDENSRHHLKQQSKLVEQENASINAKRQTFLQKRSELLGVYMFGLEKIAKLTTLTDAPDAILPGNF